jgi:hypothetical protein
MGGSLAGRLASDGWFLAAGAVRSEAVREADGWLADRAADSDRVAELEVQFDAPGAVRKLRRIYWSDPGFWGSWISRSGLRDLVVDLVGPTASLVFHAAFLKPAEVGAGVGFHQDQALWEAPLPGGCSFWLPLEPADQTNGGLLLCPGSHRAGLRPHGPDPGHPWHDVVVPEREGLTPLPVTAGPGDVVVWDRYLVHGSGPNVSGRSRRAMVLVFVPDSDEVRSAAPHRVRLAEFDPEQAAVAAVAVRTGARESR